MFQLVQDKTSLIDQFSIGDKVEISSTYVEENGKRPSAEIRVFNTLDAWRIQKVEAVQEATAGDITSAEPIEPASPEDDLPF